MGRRRRQSVQRYHDRVAGRYDASYEDVYWQWHDMLTWQHLKGYLPGDASAHVLDLGCGTGKWGLRLLKSGFRVTFVDISAKILDQARLKVLEASLEPRASFLHADIRDLSELAAGTFDLAVAFGEPLCSADPMVGTLRQIHRVLTSDGCLVATVDNRLACMEHLLRDASIDALEKFARDGRTHWLTRDREEQFELTTVSPSDLPGLLRRARLELVDLIGKTVLPMRHFREKLADAEHRRRFAQLEKSLWRDPAAIGRAHHLQFVARIARSGEDGQTPATAPEIVSRPDGAADMPDPAGPAGGFG